MNMQIPAPSTFEAFYKLGYRRLVPIVPHDAPISERSSLYKRVGTDQDSRGKSVGVRGQDGRWFGIDWVPYECDERDLQRWQAIGAGIGIKTGQGVIAIDADTRDASLAEIIHKKVEHHFGDKLPIRIGQAPKALYVIRVTEPVQYMRVEFGELDDKGRLKDRVEILSDGRQFVAHGIHPKTKQPYAWRRPIVDASLLPLTTPTKLTAFLDDLRAILPAAKPIIVEGATSEVSQAALKGSVDTVRKAVTATPNNSKLFGTREAYRDFGYAIKAALPDNEREAFEIFSDWCSRWEDGTNDPDIVAADWRRMKGPFRRGASWLYELAEEHNPAGFKKVDAFFDVIEEPTSLFGNESLQPLEEPVAIKWVDPAAWEGVTPPVRRWRIAGMIPDGEVTLLTGMGGVGKTLLAQHAGTCVAHGKPFLGKATTQCRVMMFLCEDSEDELQLRQRDINAALGLSMADNSPHLRIASRKYMDNLLAIWDRNSGTLKRTAVWQALRNDAVEFGAHLTIVDTIADTFGGSEIDRSQVRQFVQACLGRLAQETGGAVLALGHPSKAGQSVGGDGTSGSTAWHASVRSRLYLQHATKDGSGPFRRLENRKANYGASGDVFMLRWTRGAFELVSSKTTAPDAGLVADEAGEGAERGAMAVPSMGNVIDDAILAVIPELAAEGVALGDAVSSPYWAPRVLKRRADVLSMYAMDDIEAGWRRVVKAGRVRAAVVGRKQNRHPVMGYVLAYTPDSLIDALPDESVFD